MEETTRLPLRKFVAPEIVLGEGALNLVGQYARHFGTRKALIVTDPGVRKAGWATRVEEELRAAGIALEIFQNVTPNPKDHEVMEGADVYRSGDCDVIIAVGGGSPIDCAKGIGIVSSNNRHVLEFEGVDEVDVPAPPLICIPTTAGTAADISQFSIISDTSRGVKIAIISKTLVPDVALVDPVTTTTMPASLTAATGMDALVHAFEAYVSNASSPLTDMNALEAARLVAIHLPGAVHHPTDMTHRGNMMLACLYAGLAFSNASLGIVHAMAHSLGGFLDAAHGDCNAILLEHAVAHNFDAVPQRYLRLARAMGFDVYGRDLEEQRVKLLEGLVAFRHKVGIKERLRDIGVVRSDISRLAENASKDPCLATNPKSLTVREIEAIYEQAL